MANLWQTILFDLFLLGLRVFFFPLLVKVAERWSAEPAVPCRVTCSCRAFSAVLCAVKAALTPDANHTPPVDLQDYRTGKKKDEG